MLCQAEICANLSLQERRPVRGEGQGAGGGGNKSPLSTFSNGRSSCAGSHWQFYGPPCDDRPGHEARRMFSGCGAYRGRESLRGISADSPDCSMWNNFPLRTRLWLGIQVSLDREDGVQAFQVRLTKRPVHRFAGISAPELRTPFRRFPPVRMFIISPSFEAAEMNKVRRLKIEFRPASSVDREGASASRNIRSSGNHPDLLSPTRMHVLAATIGLIENFVDFPDMLAAGCFPTLLYGYGPDPGVSSGGGRLHGLPLSEIPRTYGAPR